MYIALAQINPVVGDLEYNAGIVMQYIKQAQNAKCDLLIFPELALTGCPPHDLLLDAQFLTGVEAKLQAICGMVGNIGVVLGVPKQANNLLYNTAVLIHEGQIKAVQEKSLLPTDGIFSEQKYFEPARMQKCIEFKGEKLGLTLGGDIESDKDYRHKCHYNINPLDELTRQGAEIIINISASPYYYGKFALHSKMLTGIAAKHQVDMIYVNQTGGNDHLIFDGSSTVVNKQGAICGQLSNFREDFAIFNTNTLASATPSPQATEDISCIYEALVLGTRDYLHKNGFSKALIGLSGGIDSAVTAALTATALGAENLSGVSMPSPYSSQGSKDDAAILAKNLGIDYRVCPIEDVFKAYTKFLNPNNLSLMDLAEENIQARIRGNILMFISNREGHMVLTTDNKSEVFMGYSTIYGDMAGGLSVLADVPKIMVYQLAEYINREREVIPGNTITKPPSAELRPDQKDEDSLPPYKILDQILEALIEDTKSIDEIAALGYDRELVLDIARRVNAAEYKRQQAPLGLSVTSKTFCSARRMPIAQHWRHS